MRSDHRRRGGVARLDAGGTPPVCQERRSHGRPDHAGGQRRPDRLLAHGFANKKPWQKELDLMLKNGFKLEVEALISKDISYVTEQYVPARLAEGNFLD